MGYRHGVVQADKLAQLRREHAASGGAPCEHPTRDKEYILGGQSGDFGCLTCGEEFTRAEEMQLRSRPR